MTDPLLRPQTSGLDTPCILHPGACHPYGRVLENGRLRQAHVVAWEAVHGPVPDGFHVHHKCENPPCVNPDHLEALSVSDHWRAHSRRPPRWQAEKTHCPAGHLYDEDNTYIHDGKRFCRTCHRIAMRDRSEAAKRYRDLVCPECSAEFKTSDARKIYCSRTCKKKAVNRAGYLKRRDQEKYHGGPSGSQRPEAGTVGVEGPDGLLYCVGCAWCTPKADAS